ncbi:teashirt homolog 3 isoform X1 [Carassius gibelio]|uniref:teashirt homolog 3 isoform X1 n=2 Tax=Carassius gibelio TaxID=101364 RepID=UPI0022795BBB|nr:teashirt homolog 3 isoform X1 [Carassius gibelio]
MPRRKQQAPKRAAAYDSENVKESTIQTEDTGSDCSVTKKKQQGESDLGEDFINPVDEQDSPTAELSGHDVDNESHTSESSDPTSDADSSIPIKNMEEATTDFLKDHSEDHSEDSLEQMKAIYKSFLNNPYLSFLSLNSSQLHADEQPASSSGSSSSNSSPGRNSYDWHQSAIAKTLQQVSQKQPAALEPSIFSTVQLYRQSPKLYGSIFTGASKFHCKSCSASYDTLLDLTVHMNETDHYRDDNLESASKGAKSWSKPRKRSLLEMEGKEDAQKVLRCMYCGHSFESLQDLSVHMIKTKHYQKVPLREPRTAIAAKVVSSFRKRVPVELYVAKSLHTKEKTRSPNRGQASDTFQMYSEQTNKDDLMDQKTSPGVHFKSQNLKRKESGISHDSLQQLSAPAMLTGHFARVTQTLQKTDKPPHPKSKSEKSQSDTQCSSPLLATGILESLSLPSVAPGDKIKTQEMTSQKDSDCKDSANINDAKQKFSISSKSDYLTEDDLKESPKMDFDILKSLENTVTSAINKAQRGAPSWGGYQSIHAAYQLQNQLKPGLNNSGYISSLKQSSSSQEGQSIDKSHLISPCTSPRSSSTTVNIQKEDKLEKKVTEKISEADRYNDLNGQGSLHQQLLNSKGKPLMSKSPSHESAFTSMCNVSEGHTNEREIQKHTQDYRTHPTSDLYDNAGLLSAHPEPKQPSVSPLSALQSVMNLHLGKAAKPVRPVQDPMSMLLRMSNSMAERAALAGPSGHSAKLSQLHSDCPEISRDQPIDLSKGKSEQCLRAAALPGKALSSSVSGVSVRESASSEILSTASPLRENALSDISDMLRNLSDSRVLKSPTLLCKPEQSEIEGSHTSDEAEDTSMVHKRKGRQSHWKPQHLLILQAQFASCLRQTADGKYVISDLSSQERMVISHITGLSMTTISHWLANVKYQLRRTGRTKFIKNVDSGHPIFYCSECATQFQVRSTYICHLESHLGFKMKDLEKLTSKDLNRRITKHSKSPPMKPAIPPVLPARGCQEQLPPVPAL